MSQDQQRKIVVIEELLQKIEAELKATRVVLKGG